MSLRDDIQQRVLCSTKSSLILELATGVGKTRLALEKLHQLYTPASRILIVIPRNVLIQNWKDEFLKWGYAGMLANVTFTTYVSLPKHAGIWNVIVFDEAHHLSERCQEALKAFKVSNSIFLSATLKKEHKEFIRLWCNENVELINVSTKKAIENEVLPDPKVIFIPLSLDNTVPSEEYCPSKYSKATSYIKIPYKDRWKIKPKRPYHLICTQKQYYNELSGLIDWYKRKAYSPAMRNAWLHKCNERLQFLSKAKIPYTLSIINKVIDKQARLIVFCNTIEESEKLGIPAVNSKNKNNSILDFNNKKINAIAAVNMINEGANLTDCQVGIFNAINSSDIYQIQKCGRLLRHKRPVIIIPYFQKTREEEIVSIWRLRFSSGSVEERCINDL